MAKKKTKTVNRAPKASRAPKKPKAVLDQHAPVEVVTQVTTAPEQWAPSKPPQTGASPAGWHRIAAKFECDKKYQLQEVWKIRQPAAATSDPLAVGSLFHMGRAHWFDSAFSTDARYASALDAYIRESALLMPLPVKDDAISRALSYLGQYIEYWSARAKPKVIGTEYDLKAPVVPGFDDRTARLDDVSEYPEHSFKLCIGECKTTSESVNAVVNEYTQHGQPILQSILWEMATNGAAMHGPADAVLLDVVVKGYGKEKCQFGRVPIRITQFQKDWFTASLWKHVSDAHGITTESAALRNPLSCTRQIGRMRVPCAYRDLCQRGKSAAVLYVDEQGDSVASPKYAERKGAKPWE